jgi:hypothetical protein
MARLLSQAAMNRNRVAVPQLHHSAAVPGGAPSASYRQVLCFTHCVANRSLPVPCAMLSSNDVAEDAEPQSLLRLVAHFTMSVSAVRNVVMQCSCRVTVKKKLSHPRMRLCKTFPPPLTSPTPLHQLPRYACLCFAMRQPCTIHRSPPDLMRYACPVFCSAETAE